MAQAPSLARGPQMCPISALVSPGTRHRGFGSILGKLSTAVGRGRRVALRQSAVRGAKRGNSDKSPDRLRSAVSIFSQVPENNASTGRTRTDPEIALVATIVPISLNDTETNLYRGA